MVKFFAPWCGHCQKLAPEYEKAAEELGDRATLAEVDCDQHKDLCQKHGVTGFPTLILFRKGEQVTKYAGARTSQGVVSFMDSYSGPALKTVTTKEEVDALIAASKPVAFLQTSDAAVTGVFEKLAEEQRLSFSFALATSKILPDVAESKLVVFRAGGEEEVFDAPLESGEALSKFIKTARMPFVGEISPETVSLYSDFFNGGEEAFPSGWLLMDTPNEELVKALSTLAATKRDKVVLLWADATKYSGVATHMGFPEGTTFPAFAVQMASQHFLLPAGTAVTAESIMAFVDDALAGKVVATIRSDPVPETPEVKGLTTLVGKTLPDYVQKKDMLILFHAPWCGHCKNFRPVYAEFAEGMQSSGVVVAEMDATKNDYDRSLFPFSGFPAVYYVPANGQPIEYKGDRTLPNLQHFVDESRGKAAAPASEDKADL